MFMCGMINLTIANSQASLIAIKYLDTKFISQCIGSVITEQVYCSDAWNPCIIFSKLPSKPTWFTSCNSKSREADLQAGFILTQKFHILSYLFQLQNDSNINYKMAGCLKDDLQLYIVLCTRPVFFDPLYHQHLRVPPFFYHHFCRRYSSS